MSPIQLVRTPGFRRDLAPVGAERARSRLEGPLSRRPPRLAGLDRRPARVGRGVRGVAAAGGRVGRGRGGGAAAAGADASRSPTSCGRVAARRAAVAGIARFDPRAVVYSTIGAALLWPRPGAIRYDAPAAANRPGRHGVVAAAGRAPAARAGAAARAGGRRGRWTRRRRRTRRPSSCRSRSRPSAGAAGRRDIAAITYAADPVEEGAGPRARRLVGGAARRRGAGRGGDRCARSTRPACGSRGGWSPPRTGPCCGARGCS